MPHYPWIFVTIITVWVCLTFILAGAGDRIDSTLIFDVKLLKVATPKPAEEPANQ